MFHFISKISYVSTIHFLFNESYFPNYLLWWFLLQSYWSFWIPIIVDKYVSKHTGSRSCCTSNYKRNVQANNNGRSIHMRSNKRSIYTRRKERSIYKIGKSYNKSTFKWLNISLVLTYFIIYLRFFIQGYEN